MRDDRASPPVSPSLPAPFVVGVIRSGTTLLRLMLDSHPELAIPAETHFIPRLARRCRRAVDGRDCFVEALLASPTWPEFGLDAGEVRRRVAAFDRFELGAGLRAFYGLYAEGHGKPRWGDKTATYLTHLRLIGRLLPETRFVHIIRDGRDAALSVRGLWFGPQTAEEFARWWSSRIGAARQQASELSAGRYLEVRYEELITRPEATLRRVCDFIALPWHAAMLDYHHRAPRRLAEIEGDIVLQDGRLIPGPERVAIHARSSGPPDPTRAGRWRREMEAGERRRFEAIAGDLLRDLGYEVG